MLPDETAQAPDSDTTGLAFARRFKSLRTRLFAKQITLSHEVSCTEAAISYWESGHRLPHDNSLRKIVLAFGRHGATSSELDDLRRVWQRAINFRHQWRRS